MSGVDVRLWDSERDELTDLVAASTAGVPHCFPPSADEVAAWLASRSPRLDVEETLVATRDGIACAVMRYGRGGAAARPSTWLTVDAGDGVVCALFAAPGDSEAVAALVAVAEQRFAELACARWWAFEDELGAPFYQCGFGQLSAHQPEVLTAFCARGWAVHAGEMHMTSPALPTRGSAAMPGAISVRTSRLGGGERTLDAYATENEPAGQCVWASMSAKSRHAEARRWGYVWWLGVEEAHRGRGLGRALLMRALGEMRDSGMSGACLTTNATNLVAQSLYLSVGFRQVGWSAVLTRSGVRRKS